MAKKGLKNNRTTQPNIPGIGISGTISKCPKCNGPVKNGDCAQCGY